MVDFILRLEDETRELAEKLNKLQIFMGGTLFPTLTRIEKDLLYEQSRAMNSYLQVLGKRLEVYGVKFTK